MAESTDGIVMKPKAPKHACAKRDAKSDRKAWRERRESGYAPGHNRPIYDRESKEWTGPFGMYGRSWFKRDPEQCLGEVPHFPVHGCARGPEPAPDGVRLVDRGRRSRHARAIDYRF